MTAVLSWIAAWGSMTGIFWALFERAEKVVKPEIRIAVTRWIKRVGGLQSTYNFPHTFTSVFDLIFGKHHFAWRCVLLSSLASIAAVIVMTLVWGVAKPASFDLFVQGFIDFEEVMRVIFILLLMSIFMNLIPDYISLLESRYIIALMKKRYSIGRYTGLLVLDFIATCIIGFLVYAGVMTSILMLFREVGNALGFPNIQYVPAIGCGSENCTP